jgi:hypothetical protein
VLRQAEAGWFEHIQYRAFTSADLQADVKVGVISGPTKTRSLDFDVFGVAILNLLEMYVSNQAMIGRGWDLTQGKGHSTPKPLVSRQTSDKVVFIHFQNSMLR